MTGDRAVAIMRLFGDLQVHVAVRLDGHVDEGRLARAVRLLLDTEPVLGSRFVDGWWRPHWERLETLDDLALCELEEIEQVDGDGAGAALEAAVVRYLVAPPDPLGMPMVRVRVVRHPQGDVLVVKVNHVVADGGGSKELAYRLCGLYNALGETPDLDPEPNLEGRRSLWQIAERYRWRERFGMLRAAFRGQRRRHNPARYWRVPYAEDAPCGAQVPGRTYVIRRLDGEVFRQVKAWGRTRGATLNDLVNAAYLHALLDWIRPADDLPLRLLTTVDLRRYLPGGRTEAVCNCSAFTHPDLGPAGEGGTDFADLVDRMQAEMNAQKAGLLGLDEWALIGTFFRAIPDALGRWVSPRRFTPEKEPELYKPALTNIGRIHPDRLEFGPCAPLDAFATASVVYPPLFVGCATGFGDSLTLSAGFCEAGLPREHVTRLLDHMIALLASTPDPAVSSPRHETPSPSA